MSDVSQQGNEGSSVRKKLRRQTRSKDVVIARDHLSMDEPSIHLNEVSVTPDNAPDCHLLISRRVAGDRFSDAGGVDGQSIAN